MFSYDVLTTVGKIRRIIGDTVGGSHKFEDEELQAYLDVHNGSIFMAAALAFDSLAASEAGGVTSYSRGGISVSRSSATSYKTQANQLRALAASQYAEELSEVAYDPFTLEQILYDWALVNES